MYHPRLKGNHYEMGYHYGEILHKSGQNFTEFIKLSQEQERFGKESMRLCEKYASGIMEEIKGLADGSRTPYNQMAFWLMSMYGFGDIHGCTCFCFHEGENLFLCRNSDMFPELKKTSESVLYIPEGGNIFLGNSTSFVQIEDGLNEHGLAVGLNFLMTKTYRPGLNTGFVIRLILENCKTTKEAIELIKSVPLCSTQNFILADKSGSLAVVEASPERTAVRESDTFLVSANHFIAEKMLCQHNNPEENWYASKDRYETAFSALSHEGEKNLAFAEELLSGKKGFICQYPKKLNFETLWSSIYDIKNGKVYRAEGNPYKTRYKEDTRLAWGISKKQK